MALISVALTIAMPSSVYAVLPNKTLVYCSEGSPKGFDPSGPTNMIEYTASAATLYNRLVDFEYGSMEIKPSLAESWDISKNGQVYTFHLRRGVKFHAAPWFTPSREFNAEDVLFTFERMRDPDMAFRRAYPTESPYWTEKGFDKIIQKIEAPDPYTLRFTLKLTHAPFLAKLAESPASILSAEYAAQLLKVGKPSDINWKPVGTGPFIFREYIKDATIRFDGNAEYWKPADVQLSHLVFAITPDAAVRARKLKANECQVVSYPQSADITELQTDPNLQILSQPGLNLARLAYNLLHKPLDDVRVRHALDMVIDKKAIIDQVYEGRAQIAIAPMPPLQWSYDQTLQDTPRDVEQAKELLAQAGYPDGFTLSLWAMPVSRPYNPNARLMAQIIQADWAKIGVTAEIVSYEWSEYLKRAFDGEHDALLIGISGVTDPDNWLGLVSCRAKRTSNFSKWCHKPFDDLIQRAVQITDVAERTRLYTQAQKIFKREQPFTPIAYATDYQVINKNVTGFKINPLGPTIFSGVGLK